uniref:peptidylprolyl isomerase n=1 Tax=Oncorhynchus kisutch TaxID=8019 RepID=A0A8C7D916_ONCKI
MASSTGFEKVSFLLSKPIIFADISPEMFLVCLSWFCTSLLVFVSGGKLPEAEVKITVLHKPFLCHRKSKYGDILLVHHEGYLQNGTKFHSSYSQGDKQPVWFTLGIKEVIKGWDKGLQGMCAGEKRRLVVPPALAYGKEGKGCTTNYCSETSSQPGALGSM